jgi:predicted nucleic acid-binding protein
VILDTNALSAIVDGDPKVAEALPPGRLSIPVIVRGEFRFGVLQSRRREGYMDWLAENLSDYDVLDVTDTTTTYYAEIRVESRKVGSPIPSNDVWIAALCRQHSLPILSRDRHFDVVKGLRRIAW